MVGMYLYGNFYYLNLYIILVLDKNKQTNRQTKTMQIMSDLLFHFVYLHRSKQEIACMQ